MPQGGTIIDCRKALLPREGDRHGSESNDSDQNQPPPIDVRHAGMTLHLRPSSKVCSLAAGMRGVDRQCAKALIARRAWRLRLAEGAGSLTREQ
jgi:hypothetical protein